MGMHLKGKTKRVTRPRKGGPFRYAWNSDNPSSSQFLVELPRKLPGPASQFADLPGAGVPSKSACLTEGEEAFDLGEVLLPDPFGLEWSLDILEGQRLGGQGKFVAKKGTKCGEDLVAG